MKMFSKMNVDNQVAVLAFLNLSADAVRKIGTWLEPVLSPLLTVMQIVIAVATVVWILQRVKGVKLDNKIKQKELDKK